MIHKKTYYAVKHEANGFPLVLEGPLSGKQLSELDFHEGLVAFRPPKEQRKALIEIADLPEGRVNIVRHEQMIVGYVTFVYPDPLERWSQGQIENLIELGAIEIAPEYRGAQVGKNLLRLSMKDDAMEDYIIITTEYYWHWDLKGSGLNVWEYRKVMEKMMNAGGLEWYATDDPEICSHPANCLMARIGKRVAPESIQAFDQLRFQNRFMY
ncbi:GNAT family N-acetyltransferase [Halalkalibacterium halodurans]|uniref:Acetoin dehydrogenase n=1 Tax=Halalkalibacterium halodurans (strain ATCC BAA-125 / DSM 18197 / FERM 7344 / JCM 9153 / C-125) TaxID=272558 RepID=Q9K7X3_HALH5|nr:GNAT family N-acetyltransferase [Halalkalibacterium halodurans]MDY7223768.1 GNAT family N-acetyltransferase [Halalkalibacterium halodurans]MDY7242989.1 GNAT family N-acetyltransferase [Halalkalibacterium halodurans]MED3645944.1 GNAT family N-acetyltransferase [Halalkalibacterium halodurans]MED4080012.1 GNAT family N-acetyltransferase [Halalkalibacterium halodurans]MED4084416.1 GNAT family N-acetyltransferase [Halalkalibacterium halodurans]